MIQYEEDNNSQEIAISNMADWMKFNTLKEETSTDLFKVSGEDLTKISGLSPAFRRKMGRELQKRFQGIEGTETQQNLLAQAITGYAMFDLIEPPYNLDYLSTIYEISPYNYAAINAKVSNIVGLGHDFIETRKTQEAFDNITDEKSLDRARRKLNRLRQAEHLLDELDISDISLQRQCVYVAFVTALFNCYTAKQYTSVTLEIKKQRTQLQAD